MTNHIITDRITERPQAPTPSKAAAPLSIQEGGDHYKKHKIQPMEYNLANRIPFAEGSVIKYVTRWRDKGGVQDLKKARHVLDILIDHEENLANKP